MKKPKWLGFLGGITEGWDEGTDLRLHRRLVWTAVPGLLLSILFVIRRPTELVGLAVTFLVLVPLGATAWIDFALRRRDLVRLGPLDDARGGRGILFPFRDEARPLGLSPRC